MRLSISMTRRQTALGLLYIPFSQFVLPFILALLNTQLTHRLTVTECNLIFFSINFLSVLLIFHRFLGESVKVFAKSPWRCLGYGALGIVVYFALSMMVNSAVLMIDQNFSNVNNALIADMIQEHYSFIMIFTVFCVPLTEEVLYRGVLFRGLHRKNRALAYVVSVFVFALIHILGYIGLYDFQTLMLCFLQYLPAGILLAMVYEQTDTIVAPILMHIIINLIAMSSMR